MSEGVLAVPPPQAELDRRCLDLAAARRRASEAGHLFIALQKLNQSDR